jgi:hypothetical protein
MKSLAAATTYSSWLMAVLLSILLLKKQQRSSTEEQELALLSPDPFPWEPKSTTSLTDTDTDISNSLPNSITKHHPIITNSNANEEQQLHFLSQMTFANGGLRSPSCPCCQ